MLEQNSVNSVEIFQILEIMWKQITSNFQNFGLMKENTNFKSRLWEM